MIKNYNTFLHNHESSGYKFRFDLNDDNKTGNVDIIDMASPEHEDIVTLLQDFFKVPNGGIIFDPPIVVTGQPRKCYSSLPLVIEFSIFL